MFWVCLVCFSGTHKSYHSTVMLCGTTMLTVQDKILWFPLLFSVGTNFQICLNVAQNIQKTVVRALDGWQQRMLTVKEFSLQPYFWRLALINLWSGKFCINHVCNNGHVSSIWMGLDVYFSLVSCLNIERESFVWLRVRMYFIRWLVGRAFLSQVLLEFASIQSFIQNCDGGVAHIASRILQ